MIENKARRIYEEILAVVHDSSPASLPVSRGVMVGCGQQGQDRNSKTRNICRINKKNTREDREIGDYDYETRYYPHSYNTRYRHYPPYYPVFSHGPAVYFGGFSPP